VLGGRRRFFPSFSFFCRYHDLLRYPFLYIRSLSSLALQSRPRLTSRARKGRISSLLPLSFSPLTSLSPIPQTIHQCTSSDEDYTLRLLPVAPSPLSPSAVSSVPTSHAFLDFSTPSAASPDAQTTVALSAHPTTTSPHVVRSRTRVIELSGSGGDHDEQGRKCRRRGGKLRENRDGRRGQREGGGERMGKGGTDGRVVSAKGEGANVSGG
jgi:hypothetical protein